MQIIQWIQSNPVMTGLIAVVVVGLFGGPKKAWETIRKYLPNKMPDLTPGPPDDQDAFDAAKVLCEFLPDGPAEELCKIVSPHILTKHHEP